MEVGLIADSKEDTLTRFTYRTCHGLAGPVLWCKDDGAEEVMRPQPVTLA
jgi:hypothetical protein